MRFTFIASALLVVTLCGCSDPKKPSDANFEKAIQSMLDHQPACIVASVPEERADFQGRPEPDESLDTLVGVGLVSKTPGTVTHANIFAPGEKQHGLIYDLTAKGKTFVSQDKRLSSMSFLGASQSLCYAKKQVAGIVRYSEPSSAMGQTVSEVTYTYKLTDVANWAKDGAVQKAYSIDPQLVTGGTAEAKVGLMLMSDGWRVPDSAF